MSKFVLLFLLSLTLSSCATEAETRAAMTGAVLGAAVGAVLVDQSTRASSRDAEEAHSDGRKKHGEHRDEYEGYDD